MTRRLRRRAFRVLDRRGLRTLAGLIRSLEVAVRDRELCLVRPDEDGGWRLRGRGATLVGPEPNLPSPRRLRARVLDVFCHGFRPAPGNTVLDVGAGIGREALVFSELVGARGAVHCIEPHDGAFAFLERVRALNGLDNVHCHHLAVGAETRDAVSTEGDSDRYYRNKVVFDGVGAPVPAMTLADFMRAHRIETVDLLAMNIEGAERAALEGAEPMVGRVRNVAIACHDFLAGATGDERLRTKAQVREFLAASGFEHWDRGDEPSPWLRDFVYGRRPS